VTPTAKTGAEYKVAYPSYPAYSSNVGRGTGLEYIAQDQDGMSLTLLK